MFGEFDEAAYLRANPDVRGLIERGQFRSGFEHWHVVGANEHALGDRVSGFYEHDLIYDEPAYVRHNPDVADAVRARAIRSGYQHWIRFGRQEFARGTRWGPFAARSRFVRPFKLDVGGSILLVAQVPDGFGEPASVELRTGTDPAVVIDRTAVACTAPIVVADACGATTAVRFLVCRAPSGMVFRPLARTTLSVAEPSSNPRAYAYRDSGVQAFYFASADGANEFLRAVRSCLTDVTSETARSLAHLAVDHLVGSPTTRGYEKPLSFRIESLARSDGGFLVRGWFAVPAAALASFRAWSAETNEIVDMTAAWSRSPRPDVADRFPEKLRGQPDDRYGFSAVIRFAHAPSTEQPRRLLFGLAETGRAEEWLEAVADSNAPARGST